LIHTSRKMAFVKALDELKNVEFNWKAFLVRLLCHLPSFSRKGEATCDTYVELVYNRAHRDFAPQDFEPKLDIYDLMRHDYSETVLYRKYNLIKVYDYRDK
ncbi:hypothetical protein LCGC14_3155670, partial [marine sediment metagenome]